MRPSLYLFFFLVPLCFLLTQPAYAATTLPPSAAPTDPVIQVEERLDRKAIETDLGRRLTLRERIGLSILRAKLKRQARRQAAHPEQTEAKGTNGMAIAGFVCGVLAFFVAGIILGPLAIVFSGIGLSRTKTRNEGQKGLAVAGLVLGIVATVAIIIIIRLALL